MTPLSLREVTGMISMGRDSILFPYPGDEESLLKLYDNLTLPEVLEYNMIHGKYGSKGGVEVLPDKSYLKYAKTKGWNVTFLGKKLKGCEIRVLDLSRSEVTKNKEGYIFAKIPFIHGKNLAQHLETIGEEKSEYTLRIIEHMAYSGLESLGVPIEKKDNGGKIIQKGHTIGQENLMISGINERGIVEIIATDIGYDIPDSLEIERKLDGQSTHSR